MARGDRASQEEIRDPPAKHLLPNCRNEDLAMIVALWHTATMKLKNRFFKSCRRTVTPQVLRQGSYSLGAYPFAILPAVVAH